MKSVVSVMALLHKLWPWIWRLAILSLSWQTRWFQEGVMVGGYPWEQGRIAVYGSWFFLGVTIVSALLLPRLDRPRSISKRDWAHRTTVVIGLILFVIPLLSSLSVRATVGWLMEMGILGLFFVSLQRQRVAFISVMKWIAISLLPHIALGVLQYATQIVIGNKWLGMSFQDPLVRGVSVIESAGRRVLRVYGGFPHPNIFGGWLAVTLPWIWICAVHAHSRVVSGAWILCGAVASSVLVLTFSRSAWLAGATGCAVVAYWLYRRRDSLRIRRSFVFAAVCLFAASLTIVSQSSLFITRVQPSSRLEQRSLNERAQSLQQGWELFLRRPWVGVGPGATLYTLEQEGVWQPTQAVTGPPAPPHFFPLLVVVEMGVLGLVGFGLMLWTLFLRVGHSRSLDGLLRLVPCIGVCVIGLFDHYLWSLWSGRLLLILAVASLFFDSVDEEPVLG